MGFLKVMPFRSVNMFLKHKVLQRIVFLLEKNNFPHYFKNTNLTLLFSKITRLGGYNKVSLL